MTLEALMKNDVMAVLCCPLAQDPVAGPQRSHAVQRHTTAMSPDTAVLGTL